MNRITFYLLDVIVTKLIIVIFTGFLATSTQAEIDLTTIDAFKINNLGSHSLMVSKKSSQSANGIFFLMERPHCICERVSFVLGTPDLEGFERPAEDTYIKGTMRINHKKPQEVEFVVFLARPDKEMNVIEPKNFPSIRNAKILEVDTVYGKSRFIMEGLKEVMKQATKMCESFIPYIKEKVEAKDMKT